MPEEDSNELSKSTVIFHHKKSAPAAVPSQTGNLG
jgi:hypothetical protein